MCFDVLMVGGNVLRGPCGACVSCGGCTSDDFSVCGHFPPGSIAQPRQCGTACSKKLSDESCGLGTAWWICDESGGAVHSGQRPWMQSTSRATGQTCHSLRSNQVASKIGRIRETPPLWRWSWGPKSHDLFWLMLQIWHLTSTDVVEECFGHVLGTGTC